MRRRFTIKFPPASTNIPLTYHLIRIALFPSYAYTNNRIAMILCPFNIISGKYSKPSCICSH